MKIFSSCIFFPPPLLLILILLLLLLLLLQTADLRSLPTTNLFLVGFEVFTAVVMKSIIFRDMVPCSPLSFNRLFGGTYRLHL
jgi:hypothetical protein